MGGMRGGGMRGRRILWESGKIKVGSGGKVVGMGGGIQYCK